MNHSAHYDLLTDFQRSIRRDEIGAIRIKNYKDCLEPKHKIGRHYELYRYS